MADKPQAPNLEPRTGPLLHRTLIWRRCDHPGAEYFELWQVDDGWLLEGRVVLADAETPSFARYTISCDANWETRTADIGAIRGGVARRFGLRVDEQRRWWRGEMEVTDVRGCVDVDLGFTPATNTIALRRLSLGVGNRTEVTAAWIGLPDLAIRPLPQYYERLGERCYRYGLRDGAFTTELETDELELVTRYPPAWERAPAATTP